MQSPPQPQRCHWKDEKHRNPTTEETGPVPQTSHPAPAFFEIPHSHQWLQMLGSVRTVGGAGLSFHRCEVRWECQIHAPWQGLALGFSSGRRACGGGTEAERVNLLFLVYVLPKRAQQSISYLYKAQSETPSVDEDLKAGGNFLQALPSLWLHIVTTFTGLLWLMKWAFMSSVQNCFLWK